MGWGFLLCAKCLFLEAGGKCPMVQCWGKRGHLSDGMVGGEQILELHWVELQSRLTRSSFTLNELFKEENSVSAQLKKKMNELINLVEVPQFKRKT